MNDPAPRFAGQITVFDFTDVDRGVLKQPLAVLLQCADVVGVLVGDQNVVDARRIDVEPLHFLLQPGVVVARVDHDGDAVFGVEKDVRHPFTHTGNALVDASGIQRLEDRPAAEHGAHGLLLVIRIFSCHGQFSFFETGNSLPVPNHLLCVS